MLHPMLHSYWEPLEAETILQGTFATRRLGKPGELCAAIFDSNTGCAPLNQHATEGEQQFSLIGRSDSCVEEVNKDRACKCKITGFPTT